jgi:methyl-accepting chemotaxis protein
MFRLPAAISAMLPTSLTSIKARILGILGMLAVGYLLVLAVVQFTAAATHRHIDEVRASLFPAALQLQEAEAAFQQFQKRYKDAVLLEDPNALPLAEKDADAVDSALNALQVLLAGSPKLSHDAEALALRFSSVHSRSRVAYGAMLNSKDGASRELQEQVALLTHDNDELATAMVELDHSVATQFRDQLGLIDDLSNRSRSIGWVMLLVALVGCFGAGAVLQFKVFAPLERLARRMQDIAEGDGDLTDRVEEIVVSVTRNARLLTNAALGLAETARETAREAAMQQEQAMRITTSMDEISTSVLEISKTTHRAASDAREAEKNAHTGGQTIHSTVDTIQLLLGANQSTATKIEELGTASQAIGKIVQVIDEIANQTSLLALNAAIESARAGEHGRGFAVVAGEVRRLAERTTNATREIDITVRAIQTGTAEVVDAMRVSMRHVEGGMSSARSAGEALASIIQGSENMQQMVTQIATASSEQSTATQSVNANLNEIAKIGTRTTGSSARAVQACDHLATLAQDLNHLVGSFKVRNDTVGAR